MQVFSSRSVFPSSLANKLDFMLFAQDVPPWQRKRSFYEVFEPDDAPPISSKRQRVENARQIRSLVRDQFWNTLSKVWLTPRALQEFDRRNAAQSLKQRFASDLERPPREKSCVDISHLSAVSLKNLKRFARCGGPNLADLRSVSQAMDRWEDKCSRGNYQRPKPSRPSSETMSSLESSSKRRKRSSRPSNTSYSSNTSQTLKSSAYDADFKQKCIDYGIYMPSQRDKPGNWRELQDALANPRPSLSPSRFSDGAFDRFCEAEAEAQNEDAVNRKPLSTILGEERRDHPSDGNVPFGNMDGMAPDVFKRTKPDLYWGALPEQIDRRVRQDLSKQITPSTNDSYPAAPNFFLEVKGPDGSAANKTMQACYDGAIGARGMHALQNYGQAEPIYDNKTYTLSSTYHDGQLKIYAHHPSKPQPSKDTPQYYMTQLGAHSLTNSAQSFRQGVGAFRNARDLAREQGDIFIEQANSVAQEQSVDTTSLNTSNSHDTATRKQGKLIDSDTSEDELALGHPSVSRKRQKKGDETQHRV